MARSKFLSGIITGGAATLAAVITYVRVLRPMHLKWGATEGEIRRHLPGDDILPAPKIEATHAITIHAAAADIWPWLVQMGQGRGGMYSYEWIENLMGLKMRSANRILPEFQDLKVGDVIPFAPGGFGPRVAILDPNRALVLSGRADAQSEGPFHLRDQTPGAFFAVSWLFFLDPITPRITRLIERLRLDWSPATRQNAVYMFGLLEPSAFLMERKMLLGIQARAEAMALRS